MTADNVLFYSVVAAVAPVLFYVALIYWVDQYEKEPWWLLSAAFLWGAIPAVLLAIFFNTVLSLPLYTFFSEGAADLASGGAIAPVVEEVASRVGRTPSQVTLRWHLQRGDIVFPKSTKVERMHENFSLFDFELDDAAMAALSGLDRGEDGRTGPNPDTMDWIPS